LALQNDRQHLTFVKDIYVVGEKMARNDCKIAKCKSCAFHFESESISPMLDKITQPFHFSNASKINLKKIISTEVCPLVFGCCELSHVIFLNLRKKELLGKLSKFTK
jgi:hypothetical protein